MLHYKVHPQQVVKAQQYIKDHKLGALKGSILKGKGNLAGIVAEVVIHDLYGGEWSPTYDYDLVWGHTKVDVKTKRTGVVPLPNYECSVAAYNTRQKCDLYFFTRILTNLTEIWLLGWLPKPRYFEKAHKLNKGDYDSSNNFTCHADCYNVAIKDLVPPKAPSGS